MKHNWKTYALFLLFTQAVGGLSGWLTRDGTRLYNTYVQKPALSPPSAVFPVVWVILFALMAVGAARIRLTAPTPARSRALSLYYLQLAVNFSWSLVFFNLQNFALALLVLAVLWVLILMMLLAFHRVDAPAAWMQLPYLLWVSFAGYLNAAVWLLNR